MLTGTFLYWQPSKHHQHQLFKIHTPMKWKSYNRGFIQNWAIQLIIVGENLNDKKLIGINIMTVFINTRKHTGEMQRSKELLVEFSKSVPQACNISTNNFSYLLPILKELECWHRGNIQLAQSVCKAFLVNVNLICCHMWVLLTQLSNDWRYEPARPAPDCREVEECWQSFILNHVNCATIFILWPNGDNFWGSWGWGEGSVLQKMRVREVMNGLGRGCVWWR